MRAALVTTVLAAAIVVVGHPAPAGAVKPAQVSSAVKRAERSPSLWATVNICSSRADPNQMGVRGQMPTLGFAASLSMVIQVDYWSRARQGFVPVKSSTGTRTLSLGNQSSGLQQDGAVFRFKPHAGLLAATITFTWSRGGRVLGETERRTTAGHPDADYGSPAGYSTGQCRIG